MAYVCSVALLLLCGLFVRNVATTKKHSQFPLADVAAFQIATKTMTDLHTLSEKYAINFPEMLAVYAMENKFFPVKTVAPTVTEIEQNFIRNYDDNKYKQKKEDVAAFELMFASVLKEMVYFPIPLHFDAEETPTYMYGDSWGAAKKKKLLPALNEGTDIYDRENIAGRIPIVSVSGGTVSALWWTEVGGYALTVDTESGAKFYYGHLSGYAQGLTNGTIVKAGQLLGFMGNTGFGTKEGKTGQEQTHLHFAIGTTPSFAKDVLWINPHPFLRLREGAKVEYAPPS